MKRFFFIIILTLSSVGIMAQTEHVRTAHGHYQVNENTKLIVDSDFCDVVFISGNTDEVDINIQMYVTTKKEEDAQKYFDRWKFSMKKDITGNVVVEASLKATKSSKDDKIFKEGKCIIHISLPQYMTVDINSSFGSVLFDEHLGDIKLDISYGELNANLLGGGEISLDISFSKATVKNFIKKAAVDLSYSTLNLESIGELRLETSFSTINIERVTQLRLESSYDKVNIENIDMLNANADFTHINIGNLIDSIKGVFSYGSCEIGKLGKQVRNIDIRSDFTSVKLLDMNGVIFETVDVIGEFTNSIKIGDHLDFSNTRAKKDFVTKYQKTNSNATAKMLIIRASYGSVGIN